MRIALVEPYHGGSHAAWADGYIANSAHQVTLISHPARFWKWRMHGAFLTLAEQLEEDIADRGLPDVILASSMMDVAAFAGAVRTLAPGVPIATYFHESQFTYPLSPADTADATYPMKNWASAAASDLVIFNSSYHRETFRVGAHRFLKDFPEYTHVHRIDDAIDAAVVLPVGVAVSELAHAPRSMHHPPLIVWNHRWEHDKGPDLLLEIVEILNASGVDYAAAMCGEVFVSVPPAFSKVTEAIGGRLVQEGWAAADDYRALLSKASVVLSTADQEFFGIGVVEGIAAGAHPVVPNRLVYPERIAQLGIDPSLALYDDPGSAADLIVASLAGPADQAIRDATLRYDWSVVAPMYDVALEVLVAGSR